jgi:thiol-disulfide isomerase/thioredoxin
MQQMPRVVIALIIFIGFIQLSIGQNKSVKMIEPIIGKPTPFFELTNVDNFKNKKVNSTDFKGKHIIIDFWNKNCIACVQSFPKLNSIHKKYKEKLNFVLVGTDEKGIEEMFQTFKQKLNLEFPYAFNGPLYKDFVTGGAPHIVWIDDKGIVKAVSGGSDLTQENIEAFLKGEKFKFYDLSHLARASKQNDYDPLKPFLLQRNGDTAYESKIRYRSLITEHIPGTPQASWPDFHMFRRDGPTPNSRAGGRFIYEACTDLRDLYRGAYTGYYQWNYTDSIYKTVQPGVILELKDTSLFVHDVKNELGLYWYSLVMPGDRKVTASLLMQTMQADLKRYFGFEAAVETRKFPYLRLTATEKVQNLKTKGGKQTGDADHAFYKATNVTTETFLRHVMTFHSYFESGGQVPVLVNETGIDYNLDIDVKAAFSSWQDVQRLLKEMGFSLEQAEREFKVVVIRDAKKE